MTTTNTTMLSCSRMYQKVQHWRRCVVPQPCGVAGRTHTYILYLMLCFSFCTHPCPITDLNMSSKQQIHWFAPVSVLLALIVVFLFALSHHIFYRHLEHRHVPNENRTIAGVEVPQQEINLFAGTAFAFLVKAFLAIAVGIAYAQVFWRDLMVASTPLTVAKINTIFSLPSSLVSLFSVLHWWRSPLLFALGLLIW